MAVQGIIGRKVGMTQVYNADGRAIPVTVIQAGPCVVVQRKSSKTRTKQVKGGGSRQVTDGYDAVQLGFVEDRKVRKVTKAMEGHFKKTGEGLPPVRVLREFRVDQGDEVKVGDKVNVDLFAPGDTITVTGISKGKGFQGVVKRHHFRGGAATHGSMFHRAPGSIGASAFPSRVLKGMRAAGHMGQDQVTQRNLQVVRVDAGNNLLVVKGAVPGAGGTYLVIRKG
jgi:large subunit ribosomal protein L3